eukprot:SAG25_NODE_160_length_13390_cov_9.002708_15_plen_204_part_00
MQSHSAEAPIRLARERMLGPAFDEFGRLAAAQNATLVAYMTWGYPNGTGLQADGSRSGCPKGSKGGCFPLGTLEELSLAGGSRCNESSGGGSGSAGAGTTMTADWNQDFVCQGYAIGRGYASLLERPAPPTAAGLPSSGVGLVAPAGLAWQVARGARPPSSACLRAVDAQYNGGGSSGGALPPYLSTLRRERGIPIVDAACVD